MRVLAVAVHHEPVPDAVAYRVETADGVVVIHFDQPSDADAFTADIRAGGYQGTITVGTDLASVTISGDLPPTT